MSHQTVRYLPYSRSDVSREAWKIEDPELEELDFRRQQRTVEPNGKKNPPKIKIKKFVKLIHQPYSSNRLTNFEYMTGNKNKNCTV